MPIIHDIIGNRFGNLTVIEVAGYQGKFTLYRCLCDCGGERTTRYYDLKNGKTYSCGCALKKLLKDRNSSHNLSHTRIYQIWSGMIKRCTNPNSNNWHLYGGRGVQVCNRWLVFENFYSDTKDTYSDNLTLDRYPDKNGNYEPSNFRWATKKQQANNTRANHIIEYNNESLTISEWSERTKIPYKIIEERIRRGWSASRTLTTQKQKIGGNNKRTIPA